MERQGFIVLSVIRSVDYEANVSANDIEDNCFIYVNIGAKNMRDLPAGDDCGHLIVFKNHPWWTTSENCVSQIWLGNYGGIYARFKNNVVQLSQVAWSKLSV